MGCMSGDAIYTEPYRLHGVFVGRGGLLKLLKGLVAWRYLFLVCWVCVVFLGRDVMNGYLDVLLHVLVAKYDQLAFDTMPVATALQRAFT